jgi:hypothetical protein
LFVGELRTRSLSRSWTQFHDHGFLQALLSLPSRWVVLNPMMMIQLFSSCFFFLVLGANFRFFVYLTFFDFDTCKAVFCFVCFCFPSNLWAINKRT